MQKIGIASFVAGTVFASMLPNAVQAAGMSSAAKAGLDKEITEMIGNDGTHVPGLSVIVYKDGKKVYSKNEKNFKKSCISKKK